MVKPGLYELTDRFKQRQLSAPSLGAVYFSHEQFEIAN